jgi:Fe2+ or Zn2+ uptake regulation protein
MIENMAGRRLKTTPPSLDILRLFLEHDGLTLPELDELVDD